MVKMKGKYLVKCNSCLDTLKHTESLAESARGGTCVKCRKSLRERIKLNWKEDIGF